MAVRVLLQCTRKRAYDPGLRGKAHLRHGGITLVVRPKFDPYCYIEKMPKFSEEPVLLSFPGYHDDIWRNPGPYLALLKKDLQNISR